MRHSKETGEDFYKSFWPTHIRSASHLGGITLAQIQQGAGKVEYLKLMPGPYMSKSAWQGLHILYNKKCIVSMVTYWC